MLRHTFFPPSFLQRMLEARNRKVKVPPSNRMDALINSQKASRRRTPGSVGVRARQDPGRDSARSALAQRTRVRMRREQPPLAHRSRSTAECGLTIPARKPRGEHRKDAHPQMRGGGGRERTPQESGRVSNRSLVQPRRGRNRLVQWAAKKAHFLSLPPPLYPSLSQHEH